MRRRTKGEKLECLADSKGKRVRMNGINGRKQKRQTRLGGGRGKEERKSHAKRRGAEAFQLLPRGQLKVGFAVRKRKVNKNPEIKETRKRKGTADRSIIA